MRVRRERLDSRDVRREQSTVSAVGVLSAGEHAREQNPLRAGRRQSGLIDAGPSAHRSRSGEIHAASSLVATYS